jgi:hypothetical protein
VSQTHWRNFVIFILAHHSLKEVEYHTSVLQEQILRTLLYYDIFNYPLKIDEIIKFLGTRHADINLIRAQLDELIEEKQVFRFGEFYSIQDNTTYIARRENGNREAERYLPLAFKKAKLIAAFPFVRGVLASGSLSKGYMDEKSDLDFFIITKPGRLWIARTLLVMYKRLFLFNSHKHFCVNYFIDSDHLEIEEKNVFTATELATVIPLYGKEHYENLHRKNSWLLNFFPNYAPRSTKDVANDNVGKVKGLCEKLIDAMGGDWFEQHFMRMTWERWMKMYGNQYTQSDFKVAFKTKNYASKNHPRHFQKTVVTRHLEKIKEHCQKFNLHWKV